MSRLLRTLVALLLLSSCFIPAFAGEGRNPVWQPLTIGPGQEGKYILTRDVLAPIGGPAIDILPGTTTVDIDLNGFMIHGSDQPIIRSSGVDVLTIRNGTLAGGTLEAVHAVQGQKVVIEDVKAYGQGAAGFYLSEIAVVALRRNVVSNEGGDGIYVDNTPSMMPVEGTIADNQIKDCFGGITVLLGNSVAIQNNRIATTTAGDGIRANDCTACLVSENTVMGTVGMGIVFESARASRVLDNLVFNAQVEGIALLSTSQDMLVLNNVSSGNTGNGIYCDGLRNHIDRNLLTRNGMAGLFLSNFATDNTFGRNTVRANGAPPSGCMANPPGCLSPDVCVDGPGNSSFSDNMGPNPGC